MIYIFNSIQFECRSFTNRLSFLGRSANKFAILWCEWNVVEGSTKNSATAFMANGKMTMMMMVICELSGVSWIENVNECAMHENRVATQNIIGYSATFT